MNGSLTVPGSRFFRIGGTCYRTHVRRRASSRKSCEYGRAMQAGPHPSQQLESHFPTPGNPFSDASSSDTALVKQLVRGDLGVERQSLERLENFRQPSDIEPGDIGRIDGRNCAVDRIMKLHDRKLDRSKLTREDLGSPLIFDIAKNDLWIHGRRRSSPGLRATSDARETRWGPCGTVGLIVPAKKLIQVGGCPEPRPVGLPPPERGGPGLAARLDAKGCRTALAMRRDYGQRRRVNRHVY